MQRATREVLRAVRTRRNPLLPPEIAYSGVQCQARRGMASPFKWFKERLAPAPAAPISKKEEQSLIKEAEGRGEGGSLFDSIPKLLEREKEAEEAELVSKPSASEHKYSTANFKISRRKLNMLGRQISGKPIDYAILQMQFSQKRHAKRLRGMLVVARKHAVEYKGLDRSKLVVDEAWVTKGQKVLKRIDFKGRGRMGMKEHPDSKLTVVLREGKTVEEKAKALRERRLRKVKSPGYMREDKPLVNMPSIFAW